MLRILGGFAASMVVVMAAVLLLLNAAQAERWQVPIDARETVSAGPAVWPVNAALSAPVDPKTVAAEAKIKPPPDPVGRAKFPSEDPTLVDGLALVNKAVNHIIQYSDDASHYGVSQMMVSFPPDMKGDCEDYALTKMVMLEDAGLPIVEFARLRLVYAPSPNGQLGGHALLEVRMPKGGVAFLDNNFDELMTRAELDRRGFKFFDW